MKKYHFGIDKTVFYLYEKILFAVSQNKNTTIH